MTQVQYLAALKKLGLTPHGKATRELLCCTGSTLARWANGEQRIPALAARLLRVMIRHRLTPGDVCAIAP